MQPAAVLSVLVKADGVTRTAQQVEGFENTLEKAGLQADRTTRKVKDFGRLDEKARISVDTDTSGVDRMRMSLGEANDKANIFGRTVALIKPAAMIAGAGVAAQGLAAVAAGAVAVTSALAPLSGAMAVYPSLFAAFAQGSAVAKLGLMGVGTALEGFGKALEKPTPAINNLKERLKGFIPDVVHLRNIAQGPILRGLTAGIEAASANFGRLNPIVRRSAIELGILARRAGELVGSAGFGRDLATVGERNVQIIGILGAAALNMANALRHVIVAAGPLTMWLARLGAGWALGAKQAAEAGRETGRMAAFFESTRAVMSRLFSIAGNLGTAFWNIAKAGKTLGDELLASLDKTTAGFARWTASASGQNKIAQFFENARGPIYEVSKLIRDAVKGFMALSQQPGLEKMINQIRTGLLPVLLRVVNSTTAAFGPAFIDMVVAVAQAFEPLAGSSGPLVLYVKILTDLARVATWITTNVPGAAQAITLLVGAMAVSKAVGFAGAITGVTSALAAMRAGTVSATIAVVANRTSMVVSTAATYAMSAATRVAAAGQWLLNAALLANPIGLVILAIVAIVAAFVLLGGKLTWLTDLFSWAWNLIKTVTIAIWNAIKNHLTRTWNDIKAVASSVFGAITGILSGVWSAISSSASAAWTAIKTAVTAAWIAVREAILDPVRAARDTIGDILLSIRGKLSEAWSAVTSSASEAWGKVKSAITGAVSGAYEAVKDAASKFADIGGAIVRGIANGIRNAAGSVIEAIGNVVGSAKAKAKSLLGIGSPSKVFMDYGRMVSQGMAIGVKADAARVTAAIASLTRVPNGSFAVPVGASAGTTGAGVTIMGDLVVQDRQDADAVAARLAWLGEHG